MAACLGMLFAAASVTADVLPAVYVDLLDRIPDLTQTAGHATFAGGGEEYCAPGAVSNSLMHFAATHPWSDLIVPPRVLALGFALAIVSTVLPTFLLSAAIRAIGSSRTSLVGFVGPVATIYLAWAILSEPISAVQIAGFRLRRTGRVAHGR